MTGSPFSVEVIGPNPRREGSWLVTRTERARTLEGAATIALVLIGQGADRLHILHAGPREANLVADFKRGRWTDRGGREVTVIGGVQVAAAPCPHIGASMCWCGR